MVITWCRNCELMNDRTTLLLAGGTFLRGRFNNELERQSVVAVVWNYYHEIGLL